MNPKIVFFILLILSATGFISPPIALCAGIIFGLSLLHPYAADSKALSKFLLQASIVALGFGMNLREVLKAGRSGFLYTAIGITFAMLAGLAIGKLLAVRGTTSYLISTGTAICGGSAIAAVGPVIHASEEEMAVSLGTVFILNSIAIPWFILFFFFAAVINTYGPQDTALSQKFFTLGKLGLTATLFLIGTSISKNTLKEVGWRPLAQGVLLWLAVGSLSLYFIRIGWISLSGTF